MKQSKSRSKLNHLVGRHGETETLAERAGWMPGLRKKRSRSHVGDSLGAFGRAGMMELLEPRVLLSGDHPSFPVPFSSAAPATVVVLNGQGDGMVNGTIAAGDTGDFFRFTVTTPDFVRVLANTAGVGSTLNSRVQVFDSAGNLVAQGNDNGEITGTSPLNAPDGWAGFVPLAAGDYFVLVTGQFGTTGNYELRVGTQSTDVTGIDPMTGDAAAAGTIGQVQGDVFFHVDIPANTPDINFNSLATVVAVVDISVPVAQRLDTRLEIFTADGARVPNASDSDTGYLTGAFTTWRVSEGTRYYIRVRSDRLSGTQAVGDFGLNFDFAAGALDNPVDAVTRRGDDQTQVLANAFDTRLFRFRAEGTGLTFVTVRAPMGDGGVGLRLYDINGALLAFDDDFIGTEPQIEIPLRGGEEYFIVVDSFEPPPLPIPIAPVPILVFVEAHSTYDASNLDQAIDDQDDHVDVPRSGTPGQVRRQFEDATPLTFTDPHLLADANEPRNPALDHSYVIDATGTGRIHNINDSDLFSFTAPVDMLGGYAGNNDNIGSALYVGGSFTVADPDSMMFSPPRGVENVASRGLATFDAGSWWFAGPQGLAADGSQLGFVDNPLTPGTAGAEIYAMTVWDPDGPNNGFFGPMLVVGGDFILNIDDLEGGVISLSNIAIWASLTPVATNGNPSGYSWLNAPLQYGLIVGDANGPVRALATYDVDGAGPNAAELFAGGDFTMIGAAPWAMPAPIPATPANHIARFSGAWGALGTGIAGATNTVRALTVYDPPDAGAGNPSGMPPVADPPDMPPQLVIGGTFTNAGGTTA
ncbi:MAG: LEPR-XLL domain-containing protein, partial [Pyrinomonadaceae bacterium]|nr:LEPR-XLL domain-containing protein [Phycisphaerales bacterium]